MTASSITVEIAAGQQAKLLTDETAGIHTLQTGGAAAGGTATSALQTTGNANIGATNEAAAATPGTTGGLHALLAGFWTAYNAAAGAIADAAWTSGSGSMIALLKAIAGAAISTNPVLTYFSDTYVNITTKTTTVVKSGAGTLSRIIITPGTADTLAIYDNTAGSGTLIATITNVAGTAPISLVFGCAFATGLTIVSGGTTAGNYTVIYR